MTGDGRANGVGRFCCVRRVRAGVDGLRGLGAELFGAILHHPADPGKVDRVLLCSGKLYFELAEERARLKDDKVAILRLEQLYPLREAELTKVLARYQPKQFVWVQEEPENMGARQYLSTRLPALVGDRPLSWVHRPMSGSPATGSHKAHVIEQRRILDAAFKR